MSSAVDEMVAILNGEEDFLLHYGMPRRSGRYPWGSGEKGYQHSIDFLGRVEELRKQGITYTDEETGKTYTGDTAIAKTLGLTTSQFRTQVGLAVDERRLHQYATIKRLKEKEGLGSTEIGRRLGLPESTVRSLYIAGNESRMKAAENTAVFIKAQVDKNGPTDVGAGVERELNISKERLNQALHVLELQGYEIYGGRIPQATNPGRWTTQKVICPPGTEHKEIFDFKNVHSLKNYISRDDGETYEKKFTYPSSMNSKRLKIRYSEDGGIEKDGVIEIRRGCQDLDLQGRHYSQVRILVDGTHYLKGMAVYSDDLPDGIDVLFNTNKKRGTPMKEVLKEIKPDPDNPFGSSIKDADQGGQYWYIDKKTGEKKLGLINKRADEGDWTEWKDALPSQFLSKQSLNMAKKQLNLAKVDKLAEYDEISSLTNPTIKKHLLQKFSDECDSAAVHLQAAALPGQKYHVILPITTLKDNEIYAPRYEPGSKLALIRYPHGGTFEIPILTVNNSNPEGKKIIGPGSTDAVGINSKVAARLSGADFDGDTVMCIPTHDKYGRVKITNKPPLKGLEGFDPKLEYPERAGMRYMKDPKTGKDSTQSEMGKISNLITDMTLAGAPDDEIARAVRHSMVVIDAAKHKLDYKRSEIENNIAALRKDYQGKASGGAATIVSRASGQYSVIKRQGTPKVNMSGKEWYDPSKPEGALIYKEADDAYYPDRKYNKASGIMTLRTSDGRKITYNVNDKVASDLYTPIKKVDPDTASVTYTDRTGTIHYKLKKRMQKSTKMAETDNANTLVSALRHPMELLYADYANSMKALANEARKEMMSTGKIETSAAAKKKYENEVKSLNAKLNDALINTPRERAAQRMANAEVENRRLEYEQTTGSKMKPGEVKKKAQQALSKYRQEVGSVSRKNRNIDISDREWEAIQSGAVSENTLKKILNNTDTDKLRQRATPKATNELSSAKINRIKTLAASNYTITDIARKLGVSTSVVSKYLKGAN